MVVDVPVAVDALPALAPASDAASRALQARGWRVVTGLRMEALPEPGFALCDVPGGSRSCSRPWPRRGSSRIRRRRRRA